MLTRHKFWEYCFFLSNLDKIKERRQKSESKQNLANTPKICQCCGQPTCTGDYGKQVWKEAGF